MSASSARSRQGSAGHSSVSGRGSVGGGVANKRSAANSAGSGGGDLRSREEEYVRLNAELEAKTASLVQEAEQVMKEQSNLLNLADPADSAASDSDQELDRDLERHLAENRVQNNFKESTAANLRTQSAGSTQRPRPPSGKHEQRSKTSGGNRPTSGAVNVATVADFSLMDTISHIENKLEIDDDQSDQDDILPTPAADLGTEATIRFLKAKLRVMQEELDKLAHECNVKDEDNSKLRLKLKQTEEEKQRYIRSNQNNQSQIDKHKKICDDLKQKCDTTETQHSAVKKELDTLKREKRQSSTSHNATEVRLNRALEEVERYKNQLQKTVQTTKDSSEEDKKKIEQLSGENKRLLKQKQELFTGFKKQMKLIDLLKRQKMHIEAAKMLQFTEEEFVKALELGN